MVCWFFFSAQPPMITKSFGKQVLLQHAIINISCEAIGDRKPTVSWYHDGLLIDKALDSRVKLKQDHDLWMLQIKGLTAADSGVYRCEAKSLGGMNFSEAEILIEGETNLVLLSLYIKLLTCRNWKNIVAFVGIYMHIYIYIHVIYQEVRLLGKGCSN